MATDSSAFTFSPPPPRRRPEPEPEPEPEAEAEGPFVTHREATAAWMPGEDATTALPGSAAWTPGPDATAVAPTWDPQPAPAGPATAAAPAPAAAAPGERPAWDPAASAASAGTIGTPGAAMLDERGNLPGALVGLLAAALLTVGVFLPWIGVEGRDVSGWSASGDAKVLLAVAAIATVIAALLIGGARSLALRLGLVGLGVGAVGLGLFEIASASGIDEFAVTLELGLPLVLVGGVGLAGAGALTRHRRFLPAPPSR